MVRKSEENSDSNKLGKFLKKIAQDRQLSLRSLAKILGVSHTYVNKLIIGIDHRSNKPVSPTIYTIFKIADALEISRIEFLKQCGYLE